MNEFNLKAAGWDQNPVNVERSKTIASQIRNFIPLNNKMTALEFGAGTGLVSFFLAGELKEITMMDNSSGMVEVMKKKIIDSNSKNLKAVEFDLDNNNYTGEKFDLIFTQMALHHVADIESIVKKFTTLLNPGGYLAIADLYKEDGTFHGEGFHGHNGFVPDDLGKILMKNNFINISHRPCFTIEKEANGKLRKFEIFLLTSKLPD